MHALQNPEHTKHIVFLKEFSSILSILVTNVQHPDMLKNNNCQIQTSTVKVQHNLTSLSLLRYREQHRSCINNSLLS